MLYNQDFYKIGAVIVGDPNRGESGWRITVDDFAFGEVIQNWETVRIVQREVMSVLTLISRRDEYGNLIK